VTSADLRNDHTWNENSFPVCTTNKYSYGNLSSITEKTKGSSEVKKPAEAEKVIQSDLVLISGGTFTNKTSNYYKKKASMPDFFIGKYEITQKEWIEIMRKNPSTNKGDKLPVENVSWNDCIEYCNKRSAREGLAPYYTINARKKTVTRNLKANGYRLPTDIEWEYAASGGSQSKLFLYSGGTFTSSVAIHSDVRSAPVGSKAPNELGLYDMSGNVSEWCWDASSDVKAGISSPKESYGNVIHIFRGGSYTVSALNCTIQIRNSGKESRKDVKGFRVTKNK